MDPFNYRMQLDAFNSHMADLMASGFSHDDALRIACDITGVSLKSVLGDFGEDDSEEVEP